MAEIDGVNMTKKELEDWLDTDESKSVGQSDDGGESTGRKSAKRIVQILDKSQGDLTDSDREHMEEVGGYISRHKAQKPQKEDIETSKWRYSLMNWGHDPLK
jgi:hypothetical protein